MVWPGSIIGNELFGWKNPGCGGAGARIIWVTAYAQSMKNLLGFALVCLLPACGPTVEIAEQPSPGTRPRPVNCSAGAAPTFGPIERHEIAPKPAALGPVAFDPETRQALLIGGLSSSGVYANRITALNVDTLEHRELAITGDSVKLPALALPVWDPENSRTIVLGGTSGGPDLAQVFSVSVQGDTAIIRRLPDYPVGSTFQPAAAYDPIAKRLIATAFIYSDDATQLAYRATFALDLTPGAEQWSEILPGEMGPPQVQSGETREMIYDPSRDWMILVGSGEKANPGRVWTLDLQNPKQWIGLSGALPAQTLYGPSFVWDEPSCSMLYLSRSTTLCTAQAWSAEVSKTAFETTLLSPMIWGSGGPGYGTILRDDARDRLLILGGTQCDGSQNFSTTVEVIPMQR